MDFTPTPEQQELKNAVRDFATRECTPERLLAWEGEAPGIDDATRRAIVGLGWLGVGAPEAVGGTGGSLIDLACLVEECARGLVPRAVTGAHPRGRGAGRSRPGARRCSPISSRAGRRSRSPSTRRPRAIRAPIAPRSSGAGSDARVTGRKAYVPDASEADLHLVAAREASGLSLVLVENRAPAVRTSARQDLRRRPAGARRVRARAAASAGVGAAGAAEASLARVVRRQTALALAEMVGGMDAVLDMAVAYVKEREQFGQKIALFQAVRHQIADMGTAFTAARHLAWQAITRIASATEEGFELASASAYVGQAFKRLCWASHHLHGGAGFVVEHRMRFHSERAQSLCIRYTPEAPALAEIAAALLD